MGALTDFITGNLALAGKLAFAVHISELVDTERYPLIHQGSPECAQVIAEIGAELESEGCSVLRGFFRTPAAEKMAAEGCALAPLANQNDLLTNAYSTQDDPRYPQSHPLRLFMERSNAFVPREVIPASALIHRLYESVEFQSFVAACVGVARVYEYADPFAGLVINVLKPGCQHPWHYDTNEFIASTLVQPPEDGGLFEYCPGIRAPGDENFETVGAVIRGDDRGPVKQLNLRVGDLQLFRGRFSLHRVTRVGGVIPRLSAIFAYAERPGIIGTVERTRQLFGRVSEVHLRASERSPGRADGLVD